MVFSDVIRDIKALNSSVQIIAQKMKYLVRNEKILGRNLIVLNKKLKALEKRPSSPSAGTGISAPEMNEVKDELAAVSEKLSSLGHEISETKKRLNRFEESYAKKETLDELKYVIDAINPLEFVTLSQLEDALGKKPAKKK